MNVYSLRLRLLAGAAVAIFVALGLSWVALTYLFTRHVERQAAVGLRREATQVIAGISLLPNRSFDIAQPPSDSRFSAPASGLYWQATMGSEVRRSRSLWDQELDRRGLADAARWKTQMIPGPFEHRLLVIERSVLPDPAAPPVLIQVAQDALPLHATQVAFSRELGLYLALLWLVLSVAAWTYIGLGLRPLHKLRAEVLSLKRRPDKRLSSRHPREIIPLIDAINDLAEARAGDVRRSRQRAADLAHALKTPIAALSAQSRRMAGSAGISNEGLDRAIASVAATVEAELARARAAASRREARAVAASPAQVVRRLIAVLERTDKGARTDFRCELADDFHLRIDESDLTEILGALMENATRFSRRVVRISGGPEAEGGRIVIEDDGPGLTPDEAERVLGRGIRLDERSGGHGLGIAIAKDMCEAAEGELSLGRADLGGLRAELIWID